MRLMHSVRWLLLALLLSAIPASSYAGVFISVGFAPPVLPVYEQPPCPEPGLMWTPGYWAYGDDGYYWVPGAWVPAPYEGALWTPGYWGWSDSFYMWHPGYWGLHVGYYGGVNYGFGYMGVGFVGGMWRDHVFAYNTAVVHVDERVIHTTYRDHMIVERNTIFNDRRVAFAGGPGGIRHEATPEERMAEHERHVAATSYQTQHEQTFRGDRTAYFRNNGGRPQTPAVSRPMPAAHPGVGNEPRPGGQMHYGQPAPEGRPEFSRPAPQEQQRPQMQQPRQAPQDQQRPQMQQPRPAPETQQPRQAPQAQPYRPAPESRPAPPAQQPRPQQQAPQSRPAPQAQQPHPAPPAPTPKPESRPRPESKEKGH